MMTGIPQPEIAEMMCGGSVFEAMPLGINARLYNAKPKSHIARYLRYWSSFSPCHFIHGEPAFVSTIPVENKVNPNRASKILANCIWHPLADDTILSCVGIVDCKAT